MRQFKLLYQQKGRTKLMLDKQLCEIFDVDTVEIFFVDYIDKIDDKLVNISAEQKQLLRKKEIIQKLRQQYRDMLNEKK